jgi:hypothetical protein
MTTSENKACCTSKNWRLAKMKMTKALLGSTSTCVTLTDHDAVMPNIIKQTMFPDEFSVVAFFCQVAAKVFQISM